MIRCIFLHVFRCIVKLSLLKLRPHISFLSLSKFLVITTLCMYYLKKRCTLYTSSLYNTHFWKWSYIRHSNFSLPPTLVKYFVLPHPFPLHILRFSCCNEEKKERSVFLVKPNLIKVFPKDIPCLWLLLQVSSHPARRSSSPIVVDFLRQMVHEEALHSQRHFCLSILLYGWEWDSCNCGKKGGKGLIESAPRVLHPSNQMGN